MEAFAQAVALGVDALEFDVHVSADGVPVVHHDRTLDRTTSGSGPLATRTLAELRALDAGARWTADGGRSFPYRERGIGIPTLEEVLARFPDVPILLEIKVAPAAAAVRAAIERHGAHARVVVDSFLGDALAPFRGSRIATGPSRNGVARLLFDTLLGRAPRAVGYAAISVPLAYHGLPLPVTRFAAALAPLGVPVHVWTVNDPSVALRLWRGGVRGMVTDDPAVMLEARRRL